jgi:hypothetical protein
MGTTVRLRYPDLYDFDTPFTMWANYYKSSPRVRDSARLFAQGFIGPNATDLTTIYALNSTDPEAWGNSLAPSDLCSAYEDNGGGVQKEEWDNIYLPPIRSRINAKIQGDFNFTQWDTSIIPYLCGFETQITGNRSPFCELYTEEEILQYEYAQDLRYWYGNNLGSDIGKYQMLPIVDMVAQRFMDGPDATYKTDSNTTFVPPKIMATFTNDGNINQMAAAIGVFDNQAQLPSNMTLPDRLYRSTQIVKQRGTIAFERLSCASSASNATHGYATKGLSSEAYMRIRINEVVYPVVDCTSGPGSSCPLSQYQQIIGNKLAEAGDFAKMCNMTDGDFASEPKATFFMDNTLPFATVVKP